MENFSIDELKLIAERRNIRDYERGFLKSIYQTKTKT